MLYRHKVLSKICKKSMYWITRLIDMYKLNFEKSEFEEHAQFKHKNSVLNIHKKCIYSKNNSFIFKTLYKYILT